MREGLLANMNVKLYLAVVLLFGIATKISGTDVSATTCSANGNECGNIANATCDTTALKCKCIDGYKENTASCQLVCTAQGNECNSIPNAECVTSICKCKDGYKETANTCTQAVSGKACTAQGNECDSISNAECVALKCKCKDGYKETANTCTQALTEITCTTGGDECPTNAVCNASKKCECGPDFALQGNQCSAKSGATSTKVIVWMAFSSSLVIMGNKLLM